MSADVPSTGNLEHLKKEAKRLLRACRAQDDAAIARIRTALPGMRALDPPTIARDIRLADVQHALALERGFSSWASLTRFNDPLGALLAAVRGGHLSVMRRDLDRYAGLAEKNVLAAAALGDVWALRQHLTRDPTCASVAHDGWTPLDYVCASPLARLSIRHATSLCDCAEALIEFGADARTVIHDDRMPGAALPATARAMMSGNIGLIPILRRAGATESPEATYQWMTRQGSETGAPLAAVFREYFSRPDVRARMKAEFEQFKTQRLADSSQTPPLDLFDSRDRPRFGGMGSLLADPTLWAQLLATGYNPTVGDDGHSTLPALAKHSPPAVFEALLDRGVDLTARDASGRSVIAVAARAGNWDVVDVLRARGIPDDSTPADRLVGLCLSGRTDEARALALQHPDAFRGLHRVDADEFVKAAARGDVEVVRLLLSCGFPPDAQDEAGATALHHAAWRGQVLVVELLLEHRASPTMRDGLYGDTPLSWAHHGADHAQGAQGPCLEAARTLTRAARSDGD